MTRFQIILFWIIFTIALLTRVVFLDKYPPSLNWDEISHGYNAYSLVNTGKDQWSVSWPKFNFRAYGDYPTVANLYLTIPFIKLFGLNSLSVRLPSAIFGLIFVVLTYFLGLLIFKNKYLSLLLMFLVAISPWTLFPSRAVFQSTIAQPFYSPVSFFSYTPSILNINCSRLDSCF
jgi:4-amino-4-deoxy-L-arabinose transferase-like glycosyltransferase